MAVTEKDFTLSWGDITIGAPNTIAVTRPSSQYSFRFRCEFQGVTINLTAPELMIVSQDDTRVVFRGRRTRACRWPFPTACPARER